MSCAARNRSQSFCSTSLEARGAAFHSVISSLSRLAVAFHSVEVESVSASATSSSFATLGLLAARVEGGEVGAAAAGERVPGGREPLPQLAVGLAVDAADGLPLVEDRLEPVAGRLPARRLGGQPLGLVDERGLRGERLGAGDVAGGPGGVGLLGRDRGQLLQPRAEPVDVADDVRLGQGRVQPLDRGERVRRVGGAAAEPGFDEIDLGDQVVVAAREVSEALFGRAGLPRSDRALAIGRLDEHGAVSVDTPEGGPVFHQSTSFFPDDDSAWCRSASAIGAMC